MTNQTLCSHCNNTVVSKSSTFLLYITPLNLLQNQSFKTVFVAVYYQIADNCTAIVVRRILVMFQCCNLFFALPTLLIIELSSNCNDHIFFPLTMDVLGEHYVPKGT